MHQDVTYDQKSTIGRARSGTRTFTLAGDASRSDEQEGDAMKHSPTPKGPSMPMLKRLIRRLIGFGFDLGGLIIDEHDILNDLGAGRE